jgi:hypothetical protein
MHSPATAAVAEARLNSRRSLSFAVGSDNVDVAIARRSVVLPENRLSEDDNGSDRKNSANLNKRAVGFNNTKAVQHSVSQCFESFDSSFTLLTHKFPSL